MNYNKLRSRLLTVLYYVFFIFLSALYILPIFFVFTTAVKSPAEFYNSGGVFTMPKVYAWGNFAEAWEKGKMWLYGKNSAFIILVEMPLSIFITSICAYALTRINRKFNDIIFTVILIFMIIPAQVTLIPLNKTFARFGMFDSLWTLIITYAAFSIPFGVMIFRGFFRTIPKEMDESALIDGCGYFSLYSRIILPMAKPAIATVLIFGSLSTWNEFVFAQIFINSNDKRTIPLGLINFQTTFGVQFHLLCCGVLISMVPVMILYLCCQKYFVSGLSGAVKG